MTYNDLKPDNIMLNIVDNNIVGAKIGDNGCARPYNCTHLKYGGTWHYMSPELFLKVIGYPDGIEMVKSLCKKSFNISAFFDALFPNGIPDDIAITNASDIWSLGILLSVTCFDGLIYESNHRNPYAKHIDELTSNFSELVGGIKVNVEKISNDQVYIKATDEEIAELCDFIEMCLRTDPHLRLSVTDALMHPFIAHSFKHPPAN